MTNEQETFWAGDFGAEYTRRNQPDPADTQAFLRRALQAWEPAQWSGAIKTAIELGAGTGQNLIALRMLYPEVVTTGVEINVFAFGELQRNSQIALMSPVNWLIPTGMPTYDLVLTKGFLIHVPPEDLPKTYELIHACAGKLILIAEYYSPVPTSVIYRGFDNKLWKRDFAGELLDAYADLRLVDYGFAYHRGPHPQDDLTWFLLERT